MPRTPVLVRDATPDDVAALVELWPATGSLERHLPEPAEESARRAVARVGADPDERLLVAERDVQVVGTIFAVRGQFSPMHDEHSLHLSQLHVSDQHRRLGVATALMDAAVSWAEEKGIETIVATPLSQSRELNRFFARLGMSQVAVVRASSTMGLRAKLPVSEPVALTAQGVHRHVGQVLAQRRTQQRRRQRRRQQDG